MDEMTKANPYLKGILTAIGSGAPDLIHKCPYNVGFVNATNVKFDASKSFYFPIVGHFKVELNFYSKNKMPLGVIRTDEIIEGELEKSGSVDLPTNI